MIVIRAQPLDQTKPGANEQPATNND